MKQKMQRWGSQPPPDLPQFLTDLIVRSEYANLIARQPAVRARLLPEIASLHTRRDLSRVSGLGPVSIAKLEKWLAHYGMRLRKPDEDIDAVICAFRPPRAESSALDDVESGHMTRHHEEAFEMV